MKRLSVLGSTGSIGKSTLSVVDLYPERFEVAALAAGRQVDDLYRQCLRYKPRLAALADPDAARQLQQRLPSLKVVSGTQGVCEAACHPESDMVVAAISGAAGLQPVSQAIEAGKDIALANKETLVMAGGLIMDRVERKGVRLVPVDSEHNALHQCLRGVPSDEIKRLWLTASGGPFFGAKERDLSQVSVREALDHPTWEMGPKITIDSATLMNKGLEVIEAHHLFGIEADSIAIAVHPQSVIHSLAEFIDGTLLAQMSITDMRSAIVYALCDPERCSSRLPAFDLFSLPELSFHRPDPQRFPCTRLAFESLRAGQTCPAVLNAANEVAVEHFLKGRIPLTGIPRIIEDALERHRPFPADSLQAVLRADEEGRRLADEAFAALA